jgi:hypothetical protein
VTGHRFLIAGDRFYRLRGIRELAIADVPPPSIEHFRSRLRRLESGCLVWTGAVNGSGYGVLRIGARIVLAHRFAFAIAHAVCPGDRVVGHVPALDHDRRCCEQLHLEATTPPENTPGIFEGRGRAYPIAIASSGPEIPF